MSTVIKAGQVFTLPSRNMVKVNSRINGTPNDWNCSLYSNDRDASQITLSAQFLLAHGRALA